MLSKDKRMEMLDTKWYSIYICVCVIVSGFPSCISNYHTQSPLALDFVAIHDGESKSQIEASWPCNPTRRGG